MAALDQISIHGYKSIQDLENLALKSLNILIGANGAGKSNFISTFDLLRHIKTGTFQAFIQKNAGANAFLHYGRKQTHQIRIQLFFNDNIYSINLIPTIDNRLIVNSETLAFGVNKSHNPPLEELLQFKAPANSGNPESTLSEINETDDSLTIFQWAIENTRVYHFSDTTETALVKQIHSKSDNLRLKPNADNLAAFLLLLKTKFPQHYSLIVKTIRLVAPFFDDFIFRDGEEYIQVEWKEVGNPDTPFKAFVLSDGTLRFICLTTLLLQPKELMADTTIIDEPELGLHPYALTILADLIKIASEKTQLIISTQSVELINHFSANDIIVVDRENNASTFKRLDEDQLQDWLEDYSLGELWQRNIIGGRPSR
ncbi:MAG: AAA family ATPase [Methylomonas sp.]|jgi:predicted ATPase|uniref:AAA family ATPase n=1 Tax=Methylomonas sp. TaxID=418 RepID=UPI0025CBDF2F|nr:AAA family ATPase [Methylomonas sp.]MCK9605135.1 AAA family ATPase [Methylomonas sp.]